MKEQILDNEFIKKETGVDMREARFAGFWIRVWALIIDSVILIPLIIINYFNLTTWKFFPIAIFLVAVNMFYKVYMEWKYKATWGKMVAKIKVVNERGEAITLEQSLVRYSLYFMSSLGGLIGSYALFNHPDFVALTDFFAITDLQNKLTSTVDGFSVYPLLISCFFVAFDLQRQALHDKMAKTYVIYDEPELTE